LNQTLQDWIASSPLTDAHLSNRLVVSVDEALLSTAEINAINTIECLDFHHDIPWPLNQIITADSMRSYTNVLVLLLQIMRAKQTLESMASSASKGRTQVGTTL